MWDQASFYNKLKSFQYPVLTLNFLKKQKKKQKKKKKQQQQQQKNNNKKKKKKTFPFFLSFFLFFFSFLSFFLSFCYVHMLWLGFYWGLVISYLDSNYLSFFFCHSFISRKMIIFVDIFVKIL